MGLSNLFTIPIAIAIPIAIPIAIAIVVVVGIVHPNCYLLKTWAFADGHSAFTHMLAFEGYFCH
jgi:hypothetical protein